MDKSRSASTCTASSSTALFLELSTCTGTTNQPTNQPPLGGWKEQAGENPNGGGSPGPAWPRAWAALPAAGRAPRRRPRSNHQQQRKEPRSPPPASRLSRAPPSPATLSTEPRRSPSPRAATYRLPRSPAQLSATAHAGTRKPSCNIYYSRHLNNINQIKVLNYP
jgi:hypothetical protein